MAFPAEHLIYFATSTILLYLLPMMTHFAMIGNLFGPDMIVVGLIVLLLFGAKKLPELARGLGQSLNEFKKAREDFEHELHQAGSTVTPRPAQNNQPYNAQAVGSASEQDLRRQLQEAQEALRAVQQQKAAPQLLEPASHVEVEGHEVAARPVPPA